MAKAVDCKSTIPGSNPGGASLLFSPCWLDGGEKRPSLFSPPAQKRYSFHPRARARARARMTLQSKGRFERWSFRFEPLRFDPFERPPWGVVLVLSAAVLVLVLE